MSPEPFVSRAKAPPAKRSEKGYVDENATSQETSGDSWSDVTSHQSSTTRSTWLGVAEASFWGQKMAKSKNCFWDVYLSVMELTLYPI